MILVQQTPDCSDFDVIPDGWDTPAFRILLPEWIHTPGVAHDGPFHTIRGRWDRTPGSASGSFRVDDLLEISVSAAGSGASIEIGLEVENLTGTPFRGVWANICLSVNHLPGNPDWCNALFLAGTELERSVQGRYWYERVTPRRLQALTSEGWKPMHPHPDDPDADAVPLYSFVPSERSEARACAVETEHGGTLVYQAWSSPCRWCTPCPGNACMHLMPFLAEELPPGGSADIRGRAGLFEGDRDGLVRMLEGSGLWGLA